MPEQPDRVPEMPAWVSYMLLILVVFGLYLLFARQPLQPPRIDIPYSEFMQLVRNDQVVDVTLRGNIADGRLQHSQSIGPQQRESILFRTRMPLAGDDRLLPLLEDRGVTIDVQDTAPGGTWGSILLSLLPTLLLFGFLFLLIRGAAKGLGSRVGGPGELKQFLEAPAKQAQVPKVTFDDVAGQDNAKRDIAELVAFLKHPEEFRKLGAEVPRGVLLMGAPGTGKTLMARALAGEAGVPFFSISGSEFIEVFVGVGASRVRRLFEAAKKNAPSIIFVDELDSVGRTRGTGLGGGHDEREQTLNQILAEMDGFEGHEAVIVLAATNRPDVLDPALLRPGRFDRHVVLDLPDRQDRIALLRVHTRNVPLAQDVDLSQLASGTPGFSGADIKNLINEAAMLAARCKRDAVRMQDFEESRDKLLLGSVRTLAIQPDEHHRLAVHEAGHALVAYYLPHADPLYKVTIIPRGRAMGGTQQLPEHERHTLPEEYLRDRLAVILGGRSAEKILLGTVSSGADDDIRQASALARAMVSRWGMSEAIGPVDLRAEEEHPFLGREMAQPRHYSEHAARTVDEAVHALISEAQDTAIDTVRRHREELERLIAQLEQHETLHRDQIEQCLRGAGQPQARLHTDSAKR